jgi:gas vesicle protein
MVMNEFEKDKGKKPPQHKRGHSFGDIFILSLVSAACGFMLGILFAPGSGARTRRILVENIKELIDRGKFVLLEARVMSEELLDKSREKVEEVSSKVRKGS